MGQQNYSNITDQFTFQVVCNQYLTFVRNSRNFKWYIDVTMPYALSDLPPSLPIAETITVRMLLSSVDILCARVVRWRYQMMAVSAD